MTGSAGAQAKLLVSNDSSFTIWSIAYDFLWESMRKQGRLVGERGICGTRSNHVERTRVGSYRVGGQIGFDVCTLDLDRWLPRMLGSAESSDSFTLAETLPSFSLLIDKVGGIYQYDSCYVDKAIFHAEADPDGEGSLCTLVLDILAKTETDEAAGAAWPSPAPTISTAASRAPFILHEGVLTVGGTAYPFHEFSLAIDNRLQPRWVNSVSATEITPQDRYVILRTNHPFTSTERDAFIASTKQATAAAGVASTLTFTNGIYVTTFSMAGLQWQAHTPTVRGKVEIGCPMQFVARSKGDTKELIVVNVSA